MIISWVADPLCGSLFRLLSKLAGPVEAACRVAALVCCVGLSGGVKASKKVTLLTIGLLASLCISDSLKTMPELRTICLFSRS